MNAEKNLSAERFEPEDFERGAEYIEHIHHLDIRRETAGAHYCLLFSDNGIVVVRPNKDLETFRFRELERKDSDRLYELLRAPDRYPQAVAYPAAYHPERTKLDMFAVWDEADITYQSPTIETEHCKLDLWKFSEILYEAEIAETKQEKGDAPEAVATQLFRSFPYLTVRDQNLYTKSVK